MIADVLLQLKSTAAWFKHDRCQMINSVSAVRSVPPKLYSIMV